MGENAFGAYIGASRATTHKGLALMNKVSLNDLTHNVPYSLFFKNMWFKILQHNTLIKYRFTANKLQDIPDTESEKKINLSPSIAILDFESVKPKKNKIHPTSEESPPPKKTKQTIMQITNDSLAVDEGSYAKSQKKTTALHRTLLKHKNSNLSTTQSASMTENELVTACHRCIWSSSDWSCAYDSIFMIFTYMHQQPPSSWANIF